MLFDLLLGDWRAIAAEFRAEARPGREVGVAFGKALAHEALLREKIAAVLADDTLTPETKNKVIAILNSETPETSG